MQFKFLVKKKVIIFDTNYLLENILMFDIEYFKKEKKKEIHSNLDIDLEALFDVPTYREFSKTIKVKILQVLILMIKMYFLL